MKEVTIGWKGQAASLPQEVQLGRGAYYLLRGTEQLLLVSRRCPHAGKAVELEDGELVCPMHGWSFDAATGACLNVPGLGLTAYPVLERGERLVALLPDEIVTE